MLLPSVFLSMCSFNICTELSLPAQKTFTHLNRLQFYIEHIQAPFVQCIFALGDILQDRYIYRFLSQNQHSSPFVVHQTGHQSKPPIQNNIANLQKYIINFLSEMAATISDKRFSHSIFSFSFSFFISCSAPEIQILTHCSPSVFPTLFPTI